MEYITIISIIVTMTAWDFVIGVLFGIVVSCKGAILFQRTLFMLLYRFLLCDTEFAKKEHTRFLCRGLGNFHCEATCGTQGVHPRGVKADEGVSSPGYVNIPLSCSGN